MTRFILPLVLGAAWIWAFGRGGTGKWRQRTGIATLIAFSLFCWAPAAWLVSLSLENTYPRRARPDASADAIVVLSGEIRWAFSAPVDPYPGPSTFVRCRHAAWLYRKGPAVPMLVSGGTPKSRDRTFPSAAEVMKASLMEMGVPADRIWTEGNSRNTHENAVESARLLRSRGIRRVILVTEAYHMRRSAACFRKEGIEVVEAPCGFRSELFDPREVDDWLPARKAIEWNDEHLREWAALTAYWLRGWI